MFNLKNVQFVKSTTFGLYEKMIAQPQKCFAKHQCATISITNACATVSIMLLC